MSLAPSKDTTACNLLGPKCAHRLVIVKLLCPKRSAISSSGVPFMQPARKRVSQVVPTKVLDLRRYHFQAVRPSWNTRPVPSPRPWTTLSAVSAASFNGTCMGSSFFVRWIFNILLFQSTISQVRLYWRCKRFFVHPLLASNASLRRRTNWVSLELLFICVTLMCPAVCIHQLGVAHQSSLRSRSTTMSYSNSLFLKGGG